MKEMILQAVYIQFHIAVSPPRFLMKNKKLHIRGNMQQQNENAWGKNLRSGQSALPHAGIIQIGL